MVLQNTVTVNVSMGLRYLAQAFGGILLLFYISWKLTLVMLSCVPVVAIGAVVYGNYVRRLAKDRQDALARASEVAEESFSNIRTGTCVNALYHAHKSSHSRELSMVMVVVVAVRSFSKEDYESSRYSLRVNESYELGKKIGIAFGGFAGGIAFVAQVRGFKIRYALRYRVMLTGCTDCARPRALVWSGTRVEQRAVSW